MDWGNVIIEEISHRDGTISLITAQLHLEGDFKKTDKKVTWLADTSDLVTIERHQYDNIITKDKLEEGDAVQDFVNMNSHSKVYGVADGCVKDFKAGQVVQIMRKGYYRVDVPYNGTDPVQLFAVPDGSVKERYGVKPN